MGASAATELHIPGNTALHSMAPQCKILAAGAFILVVVATPREQFWAYGAYALVLAAVLVGARVPFATWLRRLSIELPFVAFAVLLPFVARGRHVDVWFLSLSAEGLWAAWNILAKATVGVTVSILLTATTPMSELIRGLDALRVPRVITSIIGFMVRYAEVLTADAHRMNIARAARAHNPRWIWQIRATAHSAGTLFVRAFERGERVHLAMVSRGYEGAMPALDHRSVAAADWAVALALPLLAAVIAVAAHLMQA